MGFFDFWAARVSDAMCDFGGNSDPIDIAIAIFRRRGSPSFRRHVRLISAKAADTFGAIRSFYAIRESGRPIILAGIAKFCHFGSKFGPSSYRDWEFPKSRPPEFPKPCEISGQPGPYRFRGWDISTSEPPEFPTPCAINFSKVADTCGARRSFTPSAKAGGQ